MKTILIVDDQPEVRRLVEVTLRAGNYRVLKSADGKGAVEMAKAEKPDLIVMDLKMPGEIDGLKAVRLIREDADVRGCKIVMLTGIGRREDREACIRAGADDYIVKPFSPLELIRKVEGMIG